jgi:DNA-binding XRE family transcriptional regulator
VPLRLRIIVLPRALSDNGLSDSCLWYERRPYPFLVRVESLQRQFGAVVRRRRVAAGLTQEGLADAAGLHRTYISLLERGLRMPSILVVKQLARAMSTSMASLMKELDEA